MDQIINPDSLPTYHPVSPGPGVLVISWRVLTPVTQSKATTMASLRAIQVTRSWKVNYPDFKLQEIRPLTNDLGAVRIEIWLAKGQPKGGSR